MVEMTVTVRLWVTLGRIKERDTRIFEIVKQMKKQSRSCQGALSLTQKILF